MSPSLDRETIAQMVIVLAVCVGGWMLLIDPVAREIDDLEAQVAQAKASPGLNQETIAQMADRVEREVHGELAAILARNDFVESPSDLYGVIKQVGARHGVTIRRLDPGARRDRSDAAQAAAATVVDIEVSGAYEPIAAFIDDVERIGGFVRPVSLVMTPRETADGPRVDARYVCEGGRFAVPDVLAAMAGGDHAEQ
jgi:Tfp pilus assembly protein PilO